MYKILLACGSGFSSGFIASSMRKSAKAKGIEVEIKAVSDSDITTLASQYNLLMIGPHIEVRLEEFQRLLSDLPIKISVIDKAKYGSMDGAGVLEDALAVLG